MNEDRLMKILEDMDEVLGNLKGCTKVLKNSSHQNETSIYLEFGLKQIFVDYFIIVESFTSIMLKQLKKFKIGVDMKVSLKILMDNEIIVAELYEFLNKARLLRNRISHRYKEPKSDELLKFIDENISNFDELIIVIKKQF